MEVKEEIWMPIHGFEEYYHISNLGRVKSLAGKNYNSTKERILKPFNNKIGYLMVIINRPGEKKTCKKMHRLIAEHFIENPNNYRYINHIDSNKTNNSIDNLEWCTQSHNVKHAYETGRRVGVWTGKNFPQEMCAEITRRLLEKNHKRRKCIHVLTGKEYDSAVFFCQEFGYDYKKVKQVIKNNKNKYGVMWLDEYQKLYK